MSLGATDEGSPKVPELTLLRAIAGTWIAQVVFALGMFAAFLVTARLLGPHGRGTLAILILIPTLIQVMLELGQESGAARMAAEFPNLGPSIGANGLYYSIAVTVPAAIITAIASNAFGLGNIALVGAAGGIAVGSWVYGKVLAGVLVGQRRIVAYNLGRLGVVGSYLAAVLGIWALGAGSPTSFYYGWCGSNVVGAAILVAFTPRPWTSGDGTIARRQAGVGVPIHVANVGQFLLLRLDQLFVMILASASAVGYYTVAVNLAETLWYLPRAAGTMSLPFLAGEGTQADKRAALVSAERLGLWGSAILAIAVGCLSYPLIPLVFGNAYRPAVPALLCLLPGVVVAGMVRVNMAALVARDRSSTTALLTALALALNIVLNVVLIPPYAASGAALASSVSYALLGIMSLVAAAREWRVPITSCLAFPRDLGNARLLTALRLRRLHR